MLKPTAEQFEAVLRRLDQQSYPLGEQKKFLQAYWEAPQHARTATQLANVVGYESYRGINLQYGLLADKIANELKMDIDPSEHRLGLLCEFSKPKTLTNTDYILFLRPAFAEALESVGWVG